MSRRLIKQDSDGFFSMKENPTGASVGNFVTNMKKIAKVPGAIKAAIKAPKAPVSRVRRGSTRAY